jgi:ribosomal protein L35AE/L33A
LPNKLKENQSDSGSKQNSLVLEGIAKWYSRSKVQQNESQTILRLDGVNDRTGAQYYFGKRVVYVYKKKSGQKDKRFRVYI